MMCTWQSRSSGTPRGRAVAAVSNNRVHLAPTVPFGWIDDPPFVNRLIGLAWLANIFNAGRFPFDIVKDTRAVDKPVS